MTESKSVDSTVAPTPDQAREVAISAWTLYCADDRCGTDADYDAFTDAVESALTATERPADGVRIPVSTMREIRRAIECSTVLAAPRLLGIVDDALNAANAEDPS